MLVPKYPAEFVLEFRSVDRFLYRVSDVYVLDQYVSPQMFERLDNCHVYLIGRRARLSIVPGSLDMTTSTIGFAVEYTIEGTTHQMSVELPRDCFPPEESSCEISPYPHRELISRGKNGEIVGYTLLANWVHLLSNVHQKARDLEIVYIGKGLRKSAQDRIEHHAKLQEILAQINSNDPDSEVFALVYRFKYLKNALMVKGVSVKIDGEAAKTRRARAMAYRPSLEEQVTLVEASCIAYFRPTYNIQYLEFPNRQHQILEKIYEADFAAIVVLLDNTNIGDLRIYSASVYPSEIHNIVVDFRRLEGRGSFFAAPAVPTDTPIS
jgi:hypothetical protein